jgi:hypothetical protein
MKLIAPQRVSKYPIYGTLRFIIVHIRTRIMKLITHLHLVQWLILRGTSPPLPHTPYNVVH